MALSNRLIRAARRRGLILGAAALSLSLGLARAPAQVVIQRDDRLSQIAAIDQQIYSLQIYLDQLARQYKDLKDQASDLKDDLDKITPAIKETRTEGQGAVKKHESAEKRYNAAKVASKKADAQFLGVRRRLMDAIDTAPAWRAAMREFKAARAEYVGVRESILSPLRETEDYQRAQGEVAAAQGRFDAVQDSRDTTRAQKTAAANELLQFQGVTARMEQRAYGLDPAYGKAQLMLSLGVLDLVAVRGELVMAVYAAPSYRQAEADRSAARMERVDSEAAFKLAASERADVENRFKALAAEADGTAKAYATAQGRRDRVADEMDRANRDLANLRLQRDALARSISHSR